MTFLLVKNKKYRIKQIEIFRSEGVEDGTLTLRIINREVYYQKNIPLCSTGLKVARAARTFYQKIAISKTAIRGNLSWSDIWKWTKWNWMCTSDTVPRARKGILCLFIISQCFFLLECVHGWSTAAPLENDAWKVLKRKKICSEIF